MKNRLIIGLLCCVALAQIVTPLSMISRRENILKHGAQFKFKVAPVDPYDAFRGRYVALRVEESNIQGYKGEKLRPGQQMYALITVDEHGFAKLSSLSKNRPSGTAYIQARVRYAFKDSVNLDLPIDRYYMEESSAPLGERIYQQHSWRDAQDAYVLVSVRGGLAVVRQLYVGDKRIEDAVREARLLKK